MKRIVQWGVVLSVCDNNGSDRGIAVGIGRWLAEKQPGYE